MHEGYTEAELKRIQEVRDFVAEIKGKDLGPYVHKRTGATITDDSEVFAHMITDKFGGLVTWNLFGSPNAWAFILVSKRLAARRVAFRNPTVRCIVSFIFVSIHHHEFYDRGSNALAQLIILFQNFKQDVRLKFLPP